MNETTLVWRCVKFDQNRRPLSTWTFNNRRGWIMGIIGRLLAPWYTGRAFYKFAEKKYEYAARLFEKALKADPDSGRTELTYSCLGRCYLALGRVDDALKTLTVAYGLYQSNITAAMQNEFERKEYKEFLEAYSCALNKSGQCDQSKAIAQRAHEVIVK